MQTAEARMTETPISIVNGAWKAILSDSVTTRDSEPGGLPDEGERLASQRAELYALIESSLQGIGQGQESLALMVLDLDDFKAVNERFGHQGGDCVLTLLHQRLAWLATLGIKVFYLGGDEFAFVSTRSEQVRKTAELVYPVIRTLGEPLDYRGEQVYLQGSIGVAVYPYHASSADGLLRCAETAMYAAKRLGVDYSVFDASQHCCSSDRKALEWELRTALVTEQLALYFQPKVAFKSGRVTGLEALVRWRHAQRGLLMPEMFVPLAEQNGLMRSLTRWVLNAALRQCASWKCAGLYIPVSVNLSSSDLEDPGFAQYVADTLEAWELSGRYLEFEITETSAIENYGASQGMLSRFRAMGIGIAVDDFGTGYSSMTHLKHLPVDTIKIDKSFILDMEDENHDSHIVTAITDLGHKLGKKIVAEGVDCRKNWERLALAGCDQAQGYLISQPLNSDETTRWLQQASNNSVASFCWH